jgi:hypothetical protein
MKRLEERQYKKWQKELLSLFKELVLEISKGAKL